MSSLPSDCPRTGNVYAIQTGGDEWRHGRLATTNALYVTFARPAVAAPPGSEPPAHTFGRANSTRRWRSRGRRLDGGNPIGSPSAVTSPRTYRAREDMSNGRVFDGFPRVFRPDLRGRRGHGGTNPRAQPDVSRKRHGTHVWITRAPSPPPKPLARVSKCFTTSCIRLPERRECEENIRFKRRSDQLKTFFRPNLIETPSRKNTIAFSPNTFDNPVYRLSGTVRELKVGVLYPEQSTKAHIRVLRIRTFFFHSIYICINIIITDPSTEAYVLGWTIVFRTTYYRTDKE